MAKNDPAFPVASLGNNNEPGLTKLEWFAGMALQGMLAYSHVNPSIGNFVENCTIEQASETAFSYAYAMLAESEKRHATK